MELRHLTLFVKHSSSLYHIGGKFLFALFTLLVLSFNLHAQEICDNGIDDDSDGLIDLNDDECICAGITLNHYVPSLIPNASFEDHTCCPPTTSQLYCANDWIQASQASTDYWNTCDLGWFNPLPPLPIPDGEGFIGFVDGILPGNVSYKEYAGACLTAPMLAGTTYTLKIDVARGGRSTPFNLCIFGTPDCSNLPWAGINCPQNWIELGCTAIPDLDSTNTWLNFTITFTPTQDIYAIAVGASCAPSIGNGTHYYVADNLILNSIDQFTYLNLNKTGRLCDGTLVLQATNDTTVGALQWYKDGIALVGETSETLNVSANNYGAGDYTIVLTIGGECDALTEHVDNIPAAPIALANIADGCTSQAINFSDQSTISSGAITGWTWDFGDSNSSIEQNPTHTYNQLGPYNVSLTVETDSGCTASYQSTINVFSSPEADFEVDNLCIDGLSSFTDLSTVSSPASISNWNWDFDSNQNSTLANPSFTVNTGGIYDVELIVETTDGCKDTAFQTLTFMDAPVASFTFDTACFGSPTSFVNSSNINSGTIDSQQWNFNPGGSTLATPQTVFNASGVFNVELVVVSDSGCRDSITQTVLVHPQPVANFNYTQACLGDSTTFQNTSTLSGGSISQLSWDFGDGFQSSAANPNHLYNAADNYSVIFEVTSNEGCTDDTTIQVSVFDTPIADFQASNICFGDSMHINELSTIGLGNIDSWHWDLGNGVTLSAQNPPPYTYSIANTYNIELIVASGNCADTLVKQIEVHPTPVVAFNYQNVCLGEISQFTDQTNPNNSTINSWNWNFGNGDDSSQQSPDYEYPLHGDYTVTLEVTTADGCIEELEHDISIHPLPIVNFDFSEVCLNDTTQFDADVVVDGGTLSGISWDFDNGDNSNLDKPQVVYLSDGIYNVTLTGTTDSGCVNSLTQEVTVFPLPIVDFSTSVVAGCQPLEVNFNDLSSIANGNITQWLWEFGDGNTSPTQYPTHTYQDSGIYTVALTAVSDEECIGNTSKANFVTVHTLPTGTITTDTKLTDIFYPVINFYGESTTEIASWTWDVGDGSINFEQNFEHEYSDTGNYLVELVVINIYGCSDTVTDTIKIRDAFSFYIPNSFTPNNDGLNDGFKGEGSAISEYVIRIFNRWGEEVFFSHDPKEAWNGGVVSPTQLVQDNIFTYWVQITDSFGKFHEYKGTITLLR